MQSDLLDQSRDLRLSSAQENRATAVPKTPRESCEIEHQRSIREDQAAQVYGDVGLRAESSDERSAAASLGRLILVPTAAKRRWLFVEVDDRRNLPKAADRWQAERADSYKWPTSREPAVKWLAKMTRLDWVPWSP